MWPRTPTPMRRQRRSGLVGGTAAGTARRVNGAHGLEPARLHGHVLRHDPQARAGGRRAPGEPSRNASAPAQQGVRMHDLRHTFAVMQLMAGVHFMQVSRWLGHGTFTLTLDNYGDWIHEQDGGALNDLPEPTGVRIQSVGPTDFAPVVQLLGT